MPYIYERIVFLLDICTPFLLHHIYFFPRNKLVNKEMETEMGRS